MGKSWTRPGPAGKPGRSGQRADGPAQSSRAGQVKFGPGRVRAESTPWRDDSGLTFVWDIASDCLNYEWRAWLRGPGPSRAPGAGRLPLAPGASGDDWGTSGWKGTNRTWSGVSGSLSE